MTTDYGKTWTSVSTGIAKSTGTVHAIREHPRNPNVLFAGTEFGLYVSIDRGAHWTRLESNFPTVPVFDIAIHPRENDLILATHGRGVWIVDDITPIEELTAATLAEPLHLFTVRTATEWRLFDNKGVTGNKLQVSPNPPYGAIFQYYLSASLGEKDDVKIQVLDKSGALIRDLKGSKAAGLQRISWDLRYAPPFDPPAEAAGLFFLGAVHGPLANPGTYTVKITAAGRTVQKTFQVEEDPRVQLSPADRDERLKTQLQISQLQMRSDAVRRSVTTVRTQTAALQEGWKKPDAPAVPANVKQSAAGLLEHLDALTRKLQLAMRFEADDPPGLEYRPPSVTQRLLRLSASLDAYTSKPTATQLEELAALAKQVGDLEASWKKLADEEVPAFNRAVASGGISALTASR
jgi:Sortilin, neurotensin receptor 3,